MSAVDELNAARAAVQRNELSTAARHLLGAWRDQRSPAIATRLDRLQERAGTRAVISGIKSWEKWHAVEEAADPLDVPRQLAWVRADLRQSVARAGLDAFAKRPDDPRLASGVAWLIAKLPFRAPGVQPLYADAIALVLRGGGPEPASWLRKARALTGELTNAKLRNDVERALDAAIDTLAARVAPALAADEAAALDSFDAALAERDRRLAAEAERTQTLFAAVYADLDDDNARLVLADHLQEIGDARGEFIMLQCREAPSKKDVARARALQAAHWKSWCAALDDKTVLKDGLTFERGFMVACRVHLGYRVGLDYSGEPIWSTVRELDLASAGVARELVHPVFRSLRSVTGLNQATLALLVERRCSLPITHLGVVLEYGERAVQTARLLAEAGRAIFPALRTIAMPPTHLAVADMERVLEAFTSIESWEAQHFFRLDDRTLPWRRLLGPRLRSLKIGAYTFFDSAPDRAHIRIELPEQWEWLRDEQGPMSGVRQLRVEHIGDAAMTEAELGRALGCDVELVSASAAATQRSSA